MTNVLSKLFGDIAESIRDKTGGTDKMSPKDFPAQIDSITVGSGVGEGCVTVTFVNGDSVIFTRPVYIGDDCPDPVTQGRIETPTKESTVDTNYTFSGWASTDGGTASNNVLNKITEDTVIYSAFTESVRYYTVSFYDGETLLKTEQIAYGGTSSYTYKKDNYLFNGWTPEPTNVTTDLICYGIWEESYSFADASWEYIAQMSESGRAAEVFAVGDTKTIQITAKDGSEIESDVQIVGFNHDDLADGTGKAGISIVFVNALHYNIFADDAYSTMFHSGGSYINEGGVREFLHNTVYQSFPEDLRNHIKVVTKTTSTSYSNGYQYTTTNDKIWYPSAAEITTNTYRAILTADGVLYEYFQTADNRKKYIQDINGVGSSYFGDSGVTLYYGLRSAIRYGTSLGNGSILCYNGELDFAGAYDAWSIGFCI